MGKHGFLASLAMLMEYEWASCIGVGLAGRQALCFWRLGVVLCPGLEIFCATRVVLDGIAACNRNTCCKRSQHDCVAMLHRCVQLLWVRAAKIMNKYSTPDMQHPCLHSSASREMRHLNSKARLNAQGWYNGSAASSQASLRLFVILHAHSVLWQRASTLPCFHSAWHWCHPPVHAISHIMPYRI